MGRKQGKITCKKISLEFQFLLHSEKEKGERKDERQERKKECQSEGEEEEGGRDKRGGDTNT